MIPELTSKTLRICAQNEFQSAFHIFTLRLIHFSQGKVNFQHSVHANTYPHFSNTIRKKIVSHWHSQKLYLYTAYLRTHAQ